jgi:hypothetical protein
MGAALAVLDSSGEAEAWARPAVAKAASAVFAFTSDSRPKVRRSAQAAALQLCRAHYADRSYACAGTATASLQAALGGTSQRQVTAILQLAPFLKAVLPLLPDKSVASITAALLRLLGLGQPRLTVAVYSVVAGVMESARARLASGTVAKVLRSMLASAPR